MSDFSKAEQQNILRFAESNMNFEGFIVPANAKKKIRVFNEWNKVCRRNYQSISYNE